MSNDEIETEQSSEIVHIVAKIVEFNRQNQSGEGLKILIPDQIFSRLPFFLAELKAGNNSGKLKNEIRQLLFSLYRSKRTQKESIII